MDEQRNQMKVKVRQVARFTWDPRLGVCQNHWVSQDSVSAIGETVRSRILMRLMGHEGTYHDKL